MPVGPIRKLQAEPSTPILYHLPLGEERLPVNAWIGQRVRIAWRDEIRCIHCDRKTRKSFGQGHCYPCFTSLARCDRCLTSPELCHYHAGTCREPHWGETHCLIPHTVYLANSSGLKVGITRGLDATGRWIDQGASQALPLRIVPDRLEAGHLEVACKPFVADKTDWRRMLKGEPERVDLVAARAELLATLARERPDVTLPGEPPETATETTFTYPVERYPTKVVSYNLDKHPEIDDRLLGIKGQYLIFEHAVINLRKYAGYVVEIEVG